LDPIAKSVKSRTKSILHVEDDENDVLLVKHALEEATVETPVHVAGDGLQAIDYFQGTAAFADRDRFPLPDLVLLDLKLPFIPGLEVLKWIREDAKLLTPVIILTSSENETDIAAAYRLLANAYIVKPNQILKLVEVAKAIKDFWLTLNCPPPQATAFVAQLSETPR
jgi:CheY-like chemotaxis protein